MASLGISEFTFGYAFLYEQTQKQWGNIKAVPILPSLQKEQHVGYDALLPTKGIAYYYQFKMSDYLFSGNAKHLKDGHYNTPYFRFDLHKKNHYEQHSNLKTLAIQVGNCVFYVAPEFVDIATFNTAFLKQQVTDHSRLIPLSDCNSITSYTVKHYITYQEGNPSWEQWSTPKKHEKGYWGRNLAELYIENKEKWVLINKKFALDILEILKENIKQNRIYLKYYDSVLKWEKLVNDADNMVDALISVSILVRAWYGANLVVVGTND